MISVIKNFNSDILGNNRDIEVFLPPSYEFSKDKRYPVLYMQDGQNLFSEYSGGSEIKWNADKSLLKLYSANLIEEIILVGINNNQNRMDEYTPSFCSRQDINAGGNGYEYLKFLADELKPFIDSHFRTLSDTENTGIAGSSLGALISLIAGIECSHVFSKVGAMSPSFWWDDCYILRKLKVLEILPQGLKIWIDAGMKEEKGDRNNNGVIDMVDDAREAVSILSAKGYIKNNNLLYFEDKDGKHNERDWSRRFPDMMQFLYGKA